LQCSEPGKRKPGTYINVFVPQVIPFTVEGVWITFSVEEHLSFTNCVKLNRFLLAGKASWKEQFKQVLRNEEMGRNYAYLGYEFFK
jgi:hypothetical protein